MIYNWSTLDGIQNQPYYIDDEDLENCFFAVEYISKGGYSASEANNLVSNFKKPMDRKGKEEWKFKLKAIDDFGHMISNILTDEEYVISDMGTSKSESDPEYDPRLIQTIRKLKKIKPNVIYDPLFSIKKGMPSSSRGNNRLRPDDILKHLTWEGFSDNNDDLGEVVIIDDVITTGAHFKACKSLINRYYPDMVVYGIFLAKTVWPNN